MDFLLQKIEQILRYQKRWKKWQKVVASLACIVVFITTYALILPAITMDRDEAQSQGGIFWEDMQEAEETVASADAQSADQDGILSAEEANLIAGSELDVSEEQTEMDVVGEENSAGEGTLNPEAASERPAAIFDEVAGDVTVHVEAPEGAFPVGTTMKVEPVEDAQVMAAVQNAVEDPVTKVSAVDIIFLDASGNEIEPAAEIKVSMSSTVMQNVEQPVIVHVDEEGVGETVESEQVDGAVVFESDRFSVYVMVETEMITTDFLSSDGNLYDVSVRYNDDAQIPEGSTLRVTEIERGTEEYRKAYLRMFHCEPDDDATMMAVDIAIISSNGVEVEPKSDVTVELTIKELPNGTSQEELQGNIVISHLKDVSGEIIVETVADGTMVQVDEMISASFIVDGFSTYTIYWNRFYTLDTQLVDSSGNSIGTAKDNYPGISNPTAVSNLAPEIAGYSFSKATIGGLDGTVIQRIRRNNYGTWQYSTSTTGNNWSNIGNQTVRFVYEEENPYVKVYVYVAAYDEEGHQFKDNPEFLELLGISGDTVDGNGYFPVGEIYIDKSFFSGKTTAKWAALINSSSDWEEVLAALGELNTSTLVYDSYNTPTDYSLNQGNSVGDYMDQAVGDVNRGAGSQKTALFGWSGHSYGFEDQSVEYHLDLRFQTNKVTFITGNNGISSGASRDGTTVDVRAYIVGSPIQQPRNLVIPSGYRLIGYYNDPDFTTPWDKIGTPIQQDETVYIKITPKANAILQYVPVPGTDAGTVSLDAEGVNPDTGVAIGSTATAKPGYRFDGWYADEACTQLLSTDAAFVPQKPAGGWVDATYYAKFVEDTVVLTFIAEDNVDHVELVTPEGEVIAVTGNNTKEMKVTVNASLGPAVTVRGVASDGYVIKEWTIDGRDGALSTKENITTAIADDSDATTVWTERTYHVWAETAKKVHVTKQVEIVGTAKSEDVDLSVYFALKSKATGEFLQKNGEIWLERVEIVDGIPQNPSTVTFDGIQSGSYDVWEVDAIGNPLSQGTVVIESDSGGKAIFVSTIRTVHGSSTSNNVTVNDTQQEDSLIVINTYSHAEETFDFITKKQWYSEANTYSDDTKANINVPTGAWAEFSLYVKDQEEGDPIRIIRLDGVEDAEGETDEWVATFDGIPRVDNEGNVIRYIVKETAFSEELNSEHYYAIKDSVEQSNQTIKNAIVKGSINIIKEIDVAPKTDEMRTSVEASLNKLKIHVTGPYNYDQEFSFTDVTDPYNPKLVIENLPAGEYFVEETGYEDFISGRKWNPTLSWIKEGQHEPDKGKANITVSLTDVNTPNITLHNDYTKFDIKATKVWDDQGVEGLDHPSVSFTLYRIDAGGNKSSISTKIVPANAVGEYLTVLWKDQEQQDQGYTYEIVEGAVEGYEQVSITGDMFKGFTVTNKAAAQLRIVKTDQSGSALEGATFSFSGESINENGLVSAIPQGGTEALVYENRSLPVGTYILSETDPPAGYNALTSNVTITAAVENGQMVVNATMNDKEIEYPKLSQVNGIWTLQIANDQGMRLPNTGGSGTLPYTLGGIALIMASALMYGFRMRRRERRLN